MTERTKGRILVTGAAGFTGHHVVLAAARAGYDVRATDVTSRHYGAMFEALGVEFVASDLTHPDGLRPLLLGIDSVVHVAGIHDYSTPDPMMFAINVGGVEHLTAACVEAGVDRFVHLSSAGVYGYDWHDRRAVDEDAPKLTPPLNNYNVSKWEGEKIVQCHQHEGRLRTTIFRPAAIYGTRSEYGIHNVVKQVHSERRRKRMLMVGSGEQIEAFVHVHDLCRAILYSLENESMIGGIYNVSDDSRLTTAEFFNLVCRELFGVEKDFVRLPIALLVPIAIASQWLARLTGRKSLLERGTLHYMSCDRIWDNSRLKATGFTFEYPDVRVGMAETLRWYRENGWLRV